MATWTLADIKTKVRNLTGSPSTDQLSESDLTNYINNYYVFTMPFELKEQVTVNNLTFTTLAGTDTYAFPSTGYLTDQPMAYADGFPLIFYQDPDVFYQDWPLQYSVDTLATGNGIIATYPGTLQSPPLIAKSLIITDGNTVFEDNGDGTLTGYVSGTADGSTGTINYTTGAYSVTFVSVPTSSATIYAKYLSYQGNRPQGVLFYNNQFVFRPVPDQVYNIQMQGYINPTQLVNDSDTPLQSEWGHLIAYGAALEFFSDKGDLEKYNLYYTILKRYENVALGRTVQQFQSEQSIPRF